MHWLLFWTPHYSLTFILNKYQRTSSGIPSTQMGGNIWLGRFGIQRRNGIHPCSNGSFTHCARGRLRVTHGERTLATSATFLATNNFLHCTARYRQAHLGISGTSLHYQNAFDVQIAFLLARDKTISAILELPLI